MAYYNRRLFLQGSAAGFLGAAGALSSLTSQRAHAASSGGYKALVGIFLKGGADMWDALLPYDAPSHAALSQLRPGIMGSHSGASSRAISNLLPLSVSNSASYENRQYALAPELSAIYPLFQNGEAAVVGNVGPLIMPTDRQGLITGSQAVPDNLFSHNDQQSMWMAMETEGARTGWGGQFADQTLSAAAKPEFAALSASSLDVFLSGQSARPFRIPASLNGLDVNVLSQTWRSSGNNGRAARELVEAFLLDSPGLSNNMFGRDIVRARERGIEYMRDFLDVFSDQVLLQTTFPETGLGRQLALIANTINKRAAIGNTRQVFYAAIGGFDTHDSQASDLPGLLSQISGAVASFRDAMTGIGMWDDVTVFTMSDFGRTLSDNGDGTDHGWGNPHFVFGGSVQGGQHYGGLPLLDPASDRFTADRARLIPDVSVDQYAATLGRWFGLDDDELLTTLPNLSRFEHRDLGFLGGGAV